MLPFKKILAPTDFSEASLRAIGQASELARFFDGELCLVHVVEPMPATSPEFDYGFDVSGYEPGLYSSAEERLQEVLDRVPKPTDRRAFRASCRRSATVLRSPLSAHANPL